jgi:hypothetical protein
VYDAHRFQCKAGFQPQGLVLAGVKRVEVKLTLDVCLRQILDNENIELLSALNPVNNCNTNLHAILSIRSVSSKLGEICHH